MSRRAKAPRLNPDMTVLDAARVAIGANMDRVLKLLPLATHHADADLEYVHQLRVAIRRTAVGLKTFASCIPKQRRSALRSALARLRDAAGRARDWDVFIVTLAGWREAASTVHLPVADYLFGFALGSRAECDHDLARLHTDLGKGGLAKLWKRAKDSMRIKPEVSGMTLPEFAQQEVARRLTPFEAGLASSLTPGSLHPFRIHAKRLRYTLEALGDLFDKDSVEDLLTYVEALQEILGRLHDNQVANLRIEFAAALVSQFDQTTPSRIEPGTEEFRRHLAKQNERLMIEFERCRLRSFNRNLSLRR